MKLSKTYDPADLTVLSLGAGVQSSTMLLMALEGKIKPLPDVAIFADTGNEPKQVYAWLNTLKIIAKGKVEIKKISGGNIMQDTLEGLATGSRFTSIPFYVKNKKGKTSMLRRQCTREYKIEVIEKEVRTLLGLKKGQWATRKRVNQWLGISLDEIQRVKENKQKWIRNRWPFIELEMTREDCIEWCRSMNFPEPPSSACKICPFHSKLHWERLADNNPEDFQECVDFERAINESSLPEKVGSDLRLHYSMKPLAEAVGLKEEPSYQASLFNMECEGYCGL